VSAQLHAAASLNLATAPYSAACGKTMRLQLHIAQITALLCPAVPLPGYYVPSNASATSVPCPAGSWCPGQDRTTQPVTCGQLLTSPPAANSSLLCGAPSLGMAM
jgi:hypothetical protein